MTNTMFSSSGELTAPSPTQHLQLLPRIHCMCNYRQRFLGNNVALCMGGRMMCLSHLNTSCDVPVPQHRAILTHSLLHRERDTYTHKEIKLEPEHWP